LSLRNWASPVKVRRSPATVNLGSIKIETESQKTDFLNKNPSVERRSSKRIGNRSLPLAAFYLKKSKLRRKMKKWLIIIIAIVLVGSGIIGGIYYKNNQEKTDSSSSSEESTSTAIEYNGAEGMSALNLLLELAEVKYENSEVGAYVTEINGLANTDNEFWLYSVNDEQAMVAADKYITKDGDKIKWEYKGM
jgi:hypothetical protein